MTKKIASNYKPKTLTPKTPEQKGVWAFLLTMTDGLGQYRDRRGFVDADSRDDAYSKATEKIRDPWSIVKISLTFIGLVALIVLVTSIGGSLWS